LILNIDEAPRERIALDRRLIDWNPEPLYDGFDLADATSASAGVPASLLRGDRKRQREVVISS
jgi:hypothetical protein